MFQPPKKTPWVHYKIKKMESAWGAVRRERKRSLANAAEKISYVTRIEMKTDGFVGENA